MAGKAVRCRVADFARTVEAGRDNHLAAEVFLLRLEEAEEEDIRS